MIVHLRSLHQRNNRKNNIRYQVLSFFSTAAHSMYVIIHTHKNPYDTHFISFDVKADR